MFSCMCEYRHRHQNVFLKIWEERKTAPHTPRYKHLNYLFVLCMFIYHSYHHFSSAQNCLHLFIVCYRYNILLYSGASQCTSAFGCPFKSVFKSCFHLCPTLLWQIHFLLRINKVIHLSSSVICQSTYPSICHRSIHPSITEWWFRVNHTALKDWSAASEQKAFKRPPCGKWTWRRPGTTFRHWHAHTATPSSKTKRETLRTMLRNPSLHILPSLKVHLLMPTTAWSWTWGIFRSGGLLWSHYKFYKLNYTYTWTVCVVWQQNLSCWGPKPLGGVLDL